MRTTKDIAYWRLPAAGPPLQLLSEGEVWGETSEPNEFGIWILEEGEMPDFSEFE